ncbi:rRNA maturation RNase YbeY [Kamptonema cortianum]|nr:rRNA maturation RNase YbeY [Oscillatoria laete-virens]MDK3159614.1 rRNA maturation RNase YbeY [Kamptonema cortianum]MDL5050262.1 rRNA maturation RNase YbeY [Oscillatoria amoena NRMC-F 0135]MDL5055098.1 rRNA maturation RNase YbeY [Oscillatoria laete-virens NRMC-F 0139]
MKRVKNPPLNLPRLKKLAARILDLQPIPHGELEIALVDDAQIARIHEEFMNDPTPTDIITFPLGADCAQLVISLETCARQALEFGNSFENELTLYMIHGVLHLAGYDDRTPAQIAQMRAMENEVMSAIKDTKG